MVSELSLGFWANLPPIGVHVLIFMPQVRSVGEFRRIPWMAQLPVGFSFLWQLDLLLLEGSGISNDHGCSNGSVLGSSSHLEHLLSTI
uniref:Uncharacterized protein n=1 Tax=Fagus sylvatica TaxID=28930 RepID=A0A2N9ENX5_FAGSY